MGIEDAFKRIQGNYISELPEIYDQIEEHVLTFEKNANDEESFRGFQGKLHSMKGTAGSLELNFLTTSCHNLEDYLAANGDKPHNELAQTCLNVIDLMKEYSNSFDTVGPDEVAAFKLSLKAIIRGQDSKGESEKEVPRMHFLINENDAFMNKLLQKILANLSADFAFTRNGYEALGRILEEDFDGVFTGYESELINGLNLAKMIRVNKDIKPDLKLYLITSHERLKNLKEFDMVFQKNANLEKMILEEFNKNK